MPVNRTIIINRDDINNPLHPNLWESFCDTLGISTDSDEVCLTRSHLDDNASVSSDKKEVADYKTKKCNGVCPKCGCDDIEWDDTEFVQNNIIQVCGKCLGCRLELKEYFTYDETEYKE